MCMNVACRHRERSVGEKWSVRHRVPSIAQCLLFSTCPPAEVIVFASIAVQASYFIPNYRGIVLSHSRAPSCLTNFQNASQSADVGTIRLSPIGAVHFVKNDR